MKIWVGGYAPRSSTHSRAVQALRRHLRENLGDEAEVGVIWNILDRGRPASDLLDMVERGELTLCYFSTSYLCRRVPELNVLETPFLFRDLDHAHQCLDGELGELLNWATGAATGLCALGYWDNGFRHLTNRLRPVHEPDDCRGMRVRLQPNDVHEEMVRTWGAVPVPAELSQGIELITSGRVDAQENPLANTVAYGVDAVHRFATLTGHLYGARGIYAHPATVEAWPSDVRVVVDEAVRAAIAFQRQEAATKEDELRAELTAGGMAFVDPTPEQREAFAAATGEVVDSVRRRLGGRPFDLVGSP